MKKNIVVILSFILFLPALNLRAFAGHQPEESFFSGISTVFEVQYSLYKHTKNITINISDIIAKDIKSFHFGNEKINLFLNGAQALLRTSETGCFVTGKLPGSSADKNILYGNFCGRFLFLPFLFIFTFLLQYLGLLRVFRNIFTILKYKIYKAYNYKLYALFYYKGNFYEY
ncbi:MAG: hypothetical protein WC234_05995 [Endomicrobiaceae bacterium]